MAEYIKFPPCIFKPDDILFRPIFRNTAGTTSLSGATQVIGSASGCWEATISAAKIRNSKLVQLWEVLELRSEGRLNPIIVPVCGRRRLRAKGDVPGKQTDESSIPHSDEAFFSDETGYSQSSIPVLASADMAIGVRTGTIDVKIETEPMQAGFFFSVNNRLYRIDSFEELGNGKYSIRFWPRLREAIKAGDDINFDSPACLMRLKTDAEMSVVKSLHKFAATDIELIEYF